MLIAIFFFPSAVIERFICVGIVKYLDLFIKCGILILLNQLNKLKRHLFLYGDTIPFLSFT